MQTQ